MEKTIKESPVDINDLLCSRVARPERLNRRVGEQKVGDRARDLGRGHSK